MQAGHAVDIPLRGLHRYRVGNAVGRVEPIGRGGLRAARQRRQHCGGDVFFGQAHQRGQRAVDIDVQRRLLKRLLDARVRDPRNRPDLRQQRIGIFAIGRKVAAGDLQVDRRRYAEVQHLADDISRKEGEARARKLLRQFLARGLDVVVGRRMVGLEADQDVGVADPDGAGIVVGHVDAGGREPDIAHDAAELVGRNDAVNGRSDPIGQAGRLLDPRSRRCPDMQLDLAAVDGREEVLAERGRKAERQDAESHEPGDHLDPVAQTEL